VELSDIVIDPEFQGLIPPLTQQERTALRASLKADGCLTPLIVWHKHRIILDGHNRLEFCRAEDIECEIVEIVLDSREAAKAWIIKHQLGRRNLNESQRAMLATTLEEIYAARSVQRRQATQIKDGRPPVSANLQKPEKVHAAEQAAADMNVSTRLVHAAKKVKEEGTEQLQSAVRAGEVSVSAAAEVARLPKKEQDQAVAGGKKEVARAARRQREQRRASKGISPKAMKPVRDSKPLPPKTALEIPHDPLWAAKALISTFDREFIVGLVQALTNHLQGERQ
jgi:hypothetical protein